MRSSVLLFSDLSQNCQHELYGLRADKKKQMYIIIEKESVTLAHKNFEKV